MHGRVKVKSTAQQQEEKRIEREGKLKSYRFASLDLYSSPPSSRGRALVLRRKGRIRRNAFLRILNSSTRKAMAAILARRAEGVKDAQQLALTAGLLQVISSGLHHSSMHLWAGKLPKLIWPYFDL